MKQKIYSIHFTGHYPVGAVAVVKAASKEQALDLFAITLSRKEPMLALHSGNQASGLEAKEIKFTEDPCRILLNGDW